MDILIDGYLMPNPVYAYIYIIYMICKSIVWGNYFKTS